MTARAFEPRAGATVSINISASTQSVKVADDNGAVDVRVMNNGTATVWIRFGTSSVESTTSNIPIPPGGVEVFRAPVQTGALYVAAIAAGSTGYIYFTPGSGI